MRLSLAHTGQNGPYARFRLPEWLGQSYSEPEIFWQTYFDSFARHGGDATRARYQEGCDFYHDLVARHLGAQNPAFVLCHGDKAEERLSYQALHERVRMLCATWEQAGVSAGQCLATVLPMGVAYVVATLSALKMGLTLVPLPVEGRRLASAALATSGADWWVTEDRYAQGMETELARLNLRAGSAPLPGADRSHYYGDKESVLRVMSPVRASIDTMVDVAAGTLYRSMVRDGSLAFGVAQGDALAAPGFCPIQHQPSLLFATLCAGATFVEMSEDAISQAPELLSSQSIDTLLVTARVRDALLRVELKGAKFKRWVRNASEKIQWGRWDAFAKLASTFGATGLSYFANSAAGGGILMGVARPKPLYQHVLPMAGTGFVLADTNLSGMPSVAGAGILEWPELDDSEACLGHQLLSQDGDEHVLIGPVKAHREGQTYPSSAVRSLVAKIDGVEDVTVVMAPAGGATSSWQAILLVFVQPGSEQAHAPEALRHLLLSVCRLEFGERAVPDKVEIFGLVPHHEDGRLSQAWCESQFLTGMLHRKQQVPVFLQLSHLRYAAAQWHGHQDGLEETD